MAAAKTVVTAEMVAAEMVAAEMVAAEMVAARRWRREWQRLKRW